jgi:hypothetical protein
MKQEHQAISPIRSTGSDGWESRMGTSIGFLKWVMDVLRPKPRSGGTLFRRVKAQ